MKNIQFHYIYRDGANYKNLGSVIFANDTYISLSELDDIIKSKLISGSYFYANEWEIPDLHFGSWDQEFDHDFHEFECLEYTDEPANYSVTIGAFKQLIEKTNWPQ